MKMFRKKIIPLTVFASSFVIYLLTLSSSIYLEDSPEFITMASVLGVGHPTGYPLYLLLGKVFSWLPYGTLAWRVGLLSALASSGALVFLSLLIRQQVKNYWLSLVLPLVMAFSPVWWSQSVVAEVYTLYALLALASLYYFFLYTERQQKKYLLVALAVWALGIANHPLLVFLLPAYLLYLFVFNRSVFTNRLLWVKASFWLLAGLAIYLYIPWRVWTGNSPIWDNLSSWRDIIAYLTRQNYQDLNWQFNLSSKIQLFNGWLASVTTQFGWWFWFLLAVGGLFLWRRQRRRFWLISMVIASQILPLFWLRSLPWSTDYQYLSRVYYIFVYAVCLLPVAAGLDFIISQATQLFSASSRKIFFSAVGFLLIFWPIYFFSANYTAADKSSFCLSEDYGRRLLGSLPPQALLLVQGQGFAHDSQLFILIYFKWAQKLRPDVTVYDGFALLEPWPEIIDKSSSPDFRSQLRQWYGITWSEQPKVTWQEWYAWLVENFWRLSRASGRPLFTTFPVEKYSDHLASRPNGLLYQVYDRSAALPPLPVNIAPSLCGVAGEEDYDLATDDFLASYYYAQAAWWQASGQLERAQQYLVAAIAADDGPLTEEYQQFMAWRAQNSP